MDITERFLNYTKFDTQSAEDSDTVPSTPKQVIFAEYLKKELDSEGFSDVEMEYKRTSSRTTMVATSCFPKASSAVQRNFQNCSSISVKT